MERFNTKAFRTHMDNWVTKVDDGDLSRAWEIVIACIEVHARLDRQPKQSKTAAEREAYLDFALAFEGEEATFTMCGMLHELDQMTPEHLRDDGTFDRMMEEAIAKARGVRVKREAPPPEPPKLKLLEGGKVV